MALVALAVSLTTAVVTVIFQARNSRGLENLKASISLRAVRAEKLLAERQEFLKLVQDFDKKFIYMRISAVTGELDADDVRRLVDELSDLTGDATRSYTVLSVLLNEADIVRIESKIAEREKLMFDNKVLETFEASVDVHEAILEAIDKQYRSLV
jgi:hypothetical protein